MGGSSTRTTLAPDRKYIFSELASYFYSCDSIGMRKSGCCDDETVGQFAERGSLLIKAPILKRLSGPGLPHVS